LQLTLERWRWAPHNFPVPPIVVNIPEFQLRALNATYGTELENLRHVVVSDRRVLTNGEPFRELRRIGALGPEKDAQSRPQSGFR
jgi:hypothetical protein